MLRTRYINEIRPTLQQKRHDASPLAVPSIEKVVVNIGFGKLTAKGGGNEKQIREEASRILSLVTGQRPAPRPARKSIAGFGLRQGVVVGLTATLRGDRAWNFVERLVGVALPRTRDFRGIPRSSVDERGNLTIGVAEHIVFPEVVEVETSRLYGFEATIVPTIRNRDAAIALYEAIGVPLQKE